MVPQSPTRPPTRSGITKGMPLRCLCNAHQANTTMKTKTLLAAALVGTLAFTTAHAQQIPIPTTAAEVPGPPLGTAMTKAYVQTVGRMAYLWGWPLVNMANRAKAFSSAPEPG